MAEACDRRLPAGVLRASVVVIGDEILGGFVADTNSGFLAQRLHAVGVPLERIVTVPDELVAIGEALGAELGRARPRVLLTSGGIGSTPDDLTFQAVAAHLGTDLCVEPSIDAHLTRALARTAAQGIPVTPAHERALRRMAQLPRGAYLLSGAGEEAPGGVLPGVAVDVDGGAHHPTGATLVVLPGVPGELRRIMVADVEPALLAGRGRPQHVVELSHRYPESTLNPVFARVVEEFPDVHLGSYPGPACLVRLQGHRERAEQAAALIADYLRGLDASGGGDLAAGSLPEGRHS